MTLNYTQSRHPRSTTWWLAVGGVAVLGLLVAGGALSFVLSGDDASAALTDAPLESTSATSAATAPVASRAASPAAVHPPAPLVAATSFAIGSVSGAPLAAVEVPLRLTDAQGLGSASVKLTYDPRIVSLTSIRAGDLPQGALKWHHEPEAGTLVLLATTSLPAGVTGDHAFAFLTFEAKEGAVGEVSPLALSVRGASHADGTAADVGATDGSFRNGLAGDVLGDGTVDRADYDRLTSFLVGEQVEIVALNADIDGDGKVSDADAIRLHQYLDGHRDSP